MLPREKRLLELLLKAEHRYTTSDLANLLHVSQRTVKSDIKHLKEELKGTGCELNSQAGKGTWLICTEEGKKAVRRLLMDHEAGSFDTPEKRKYHVILKILDAPSYISMESIADSLYVSKGTIVNDVGESTAFLERQGLTLEKRAKYGVRVIGKESRIRIARAAAVSKLVRLQGNHLQEKLQPFFDDVDLAKVQRTLRAMEDHFGFVFADMSYAEMVMNVAIVVERSRCGLNCSATEAELEGYRGKAEWQIGEYLAGALEREFDIGLPDDEIAYLTMNLLGAKFQDIREEAKTHRGIRDLETLDHNKLDEILRRVEEVYQEEILWDQMLKNTLYMHLEGMFNRLSHRIHLDNPIKQMVKDTLAYEYDIATYIARLIMEQFELVLGDDEICDIALYLGASFERKRMAARTLAPTVVIACGTGMGTSLYFEARMKSVFPDIIVRKVLPISRIREEVEKEQQDCVISTVPLVLEGVKVVQVSPMLNARDIEQIKQALYPVQKAGSQKQQESYPNLYGLLNEKITILKCDCKSLEEVIGLLGQRMIREKYADSGFIESVMKRERMAFTSIGDAVAIPHAFEGHVLKTGIGLMTLKKPIMWGEERVQIVLMLAVDPKATDKWRDIFGELADLTKNGAELRRILDADKFSDLKK